MTEQVAEPLVEQPEAQMQHIDANELKMWLDNPKTKATLAEQARMFETSVSRNWFGIDRVMRKTQYKNFETAKTILDVLCLAGMAHSKFENSQFRWKITLDKEAKIAALKADVEAIDAQVILLEEKKAAILKAIASQEAETSVQE